jgi:ribosomal protein S3AE
VADVATTDLGADSSRSRVRRTRSPIARDLVVETKDTDCLLGKLKIVYFIVTATTGKPGH